MIRSLLLMATVGLALCAQDRASWTRPYPAHQIAGNLYYVGTEDLACFLITGDQGHILINTGLEDSTPLIRKSITDLGFRLEDVKILLTMQAHFDHVAAMAEVQKLTGAKVFATEGDAPAMADGGKSDPAFGEGARFPAIRVDRRLKHGDTIRLGATELKVVSTPGHSRGSVSYTTTVDDGGTKRSVAIANMGTVVMPLVGNPKYPDIAEDYRKTFDRQRELSPDIWVAGHASQYGMDEKRRKGTFVDPAGYKKAVADHERRFGQQLAEALRTK